VTSDTIKFQWRLPEPVLPADPMLTTQFCRCLLAERTGTVINFGSLGGETSDIRLFAPRSLTLKGVALGSWTQQPPEQRKADVALAQRLAHEPGALFEIAERYSPSRIADAVTHVSQADRAGVVLIDFSKD
jgi:hypothetical protein